MCCIYATAPFVRGADICQGAETLVESGVKFAFSVASFAFPIQRAIKLREDSRVEMFAPIYTQTRSQDLPEAYHDAGQFYWGTKAAWLLDAPIFGPWSLAVIVPRYRAQDIETLEVWEQAEALMQALAHR